MKQSLVVLFPILLVSAAPLHAQSLADAAKKAEEERSQARQDQVYTNQDLPEVPEESSTPAPAENKPAAAGDRSKGARQTSPKVGKSSERGKDEAYWRGRVAPLSRKLQSNREKLQALQERIYDLTTELNDLGTRNVRRAAETERKRLVTEAAHLQETIDADTRALDAIEEAGREAGALPGWFRD